MFNLKSLYALGLTPREAEVYVSLVSLGECSLAQLMDATKIRPQVAYSTVDRLVEKKLATTSERQGKRYVQATSPSRLEEMAEENLASIQAAVPDLLALQAAPQDAVIQVDRGNEAVISLRRRAYKSMKAGDEYMIIGASGDRFYEVVGVRRNANLEQFRAERGIKKLLISFVSQRELLEKREKDIQFSEMRFLPYLFPTPTSTNIYGDTVALISWAKTPIVITITSKEIAESYKQYFQVLWETGK